MKTKLMKLVAVLRSGKVTPVIDTLSMPEFNSKGYAIPGTERIVGSQVREVHIQLTFNACVSEKDAELLINGLRSGVDHRFTIEEMPHEACT